MLWRKKEKQKQTVKHLDILCTTEVFCPRPWENLRQSVGVPHGKLKRQSAMHCSEGQSQEEMPGNHPHWGHRGIPGASAAVQNCPPCSWPSIARNTWWLAVGLWVGSGRGLGRGQSFCCRGCSHWLRRILREEKGVAECHSQLPLAAVRTSPPAQPQRRTGSPCSRCNALFQFPVSLKIFIRRNWGGESEQLDRYKAINKIQHQLCKLLLIYFQLLTEASYLKTFTWLQNYGKILKASPWISETGREEV